MENVVTIIMSNLVEIVVAIISAVFSIIVIPWLKNTALPWLKEKRLFTVVYSFVKAAEKLAQSGAIPKARKKEYVIKLLEKKGITVTDEVDALIEAAVEELDIALSSNAQLVLGTIEDSAEPTTNTEVKDDEAKQPDTGEESKADEETPTA